MVEDASALVRAYYSIAMRHLLGVVAILHFAQMVDAAQHAAIVGILVGWHDAHVVAVVEHIVGLVIRRSLLLPSQQAAYVGVAAHLAEVARVGQLHIVGQCCSSLVV